MRKGAQITLDGNVPSYVQAILNHVSGIHPSVLAAVVSEYAVDFRRVTYCTSAESYEAGELFTALAYYGLGLTHNEVADHAHHSTCWVQFRLRSLRPKLFQESFVAQLRTIVLHIKAQRS